MMPLLQKGCKIIRLVKRSKSKLKQWHRHWLATVYSLSPEGRKSAESDDARFILVLPTYKS